VLITFSRSKKKRKKEKKGWNLVAWTRVSVQQILRANVRNKEPALAFCGYACKELKEGGRGKEKGWRAVRNLILLSSRGGGKEEGVPHLLIFSII